MALMNSFWKNIFDNPLSRILFYILVADVFYDDGGPFLYKRLIFSALLYLAIAELFYYYYKSIAEKNPLQAPAFFKVYAAAFGIFVLLNLFKDFTGPNLNLVTLINNPYALLAIGPVALFLVGANTSNLTGVYNVLGLAGFVFILVWLVQPPGSIKYYEGYVTSHAFIPFFIISFVDKRNQAIAMLLVLLAVPFSMISDQRIVLLKVLGFFGLFLSMNLVSGKGFLKLLIMVAGSAVVFLMLTNLQPILHFFQGLIGSKTFDVNDTRSFLYEELFSDFKSSEFFLGRGFLGTYFSDYFLMLMENLDDTGDFYQRFSVEVGFLELVLKGGYVYYILYVIPLWYVAVKGIFRYAHLEIPFFIGIYIFTELLLMFFGNTPYFGFQFSVMFLFAGYAEGVMRRHKSIGIINHSLIIAQ